MYCPRCGQQLASEIRFCSRCGLPMNVVVDVVANDGLPPVRQAANAVDKDSSRQHGTRLGAKVIFLSAVLLPLCFGLSIVADSPGPLLLPLTVFLFGSFWLAYTRLFGEEPFTLKRQNRFDQRGFTPPRNVALPPNRHAVDDARARGIDTGEFVEPPNVTDHTTRLFDQFPTEGR